jgi:hypothetical protein
MTAVAEGFSTGRKSRTYYNTGTRASPVWVEITHITKEGFNPGDQEFIQAKARGLGRALQEEEAVSPASLTFSRLLPRGVADSVYTALVASYGFGGTVYEFAIVDGDITYTGVKGWRFWGKAAKMPATRDLGQFVEQQWEIQEIVHYHNGSLEELTTLAGGTAPTTTTTAGT